MGRALTEVIFVIKENCLAGDTNTDNTQ